jgi:2-polyprenyl-3-methyl-5-hydroxy-6-metoxy-1,4-benzoquinol methylase
MKTQNIYENYISTAVFVGTDEITLTRWTEGYIRSHIAPFLPDNKSARILEIGCGYGRNLKALSNIGYSNINGIDISESQIEYASNQLDLDSVHCSDAISFLNGQDVSYDVILMLDVMEHLDVEYSIELCRLIHCSLSQDGIFILQVPNAMAPLSPYRHWDITHLRAYTTHSMEQTLRLGGFSRISHFELPPHIHGIASLVRRVAWAAFIKPIISCFMLLANSDRLGGIYTLNMLSVARKSSSQSDVQLSSNE